MKRMIVEFIGSTGAGKTSLITGVQRTLASKTRVVTAFELVAEPFGISNIKNLSIQHLIQEVVGLPYFLRSLGRYKDFVFLTLSMLARQADYNLFLVNNLRSLERKIGVHEMIRRRDGDRVILVDEGTVLTAHNVFVYSSVVYTREEIAQFARLVPLPDMIVYVRAPVEVLVQRTLLRDDPPREMKSKNRAQIEKYVARAVSMFDQLTQILEIQHRLLVVENHDIGKRGLDELVKRIADSILIRKKLLEEGINHHPGFGKFAKEHIE